MTRQTTGQAAQRARVKQRRRFRGPALPDAKGIIVERTQGGVSYKAWAAGKAARFARVQRVALLHRRR